MGRDLRQDPVIGIAEKISHGLEGSGSGEIRSLTVPSQSAADQSRVPRPWGTVSKA